MRDTCYIVDYELNQTFNMFYDGIQDPRRPDKLPPGPRV
jgi:hypothetical protein